MNDMSRYLQPGRNRSELIILIHGLGNASKRLKDARKILRAERPDADIFAPLLPYGEDALCTVKAECIVADVLEYIDELVDQRGGENGYKSIAIVGHSFGAVLARKIAIVAFGEQRNVDGDVPAPFEREFAAFRTARPWARRIRRLVLLAGMNRGWSPASTMSWWDSVIWTVGEFYGDVVMGGEPTLFAIRRGAPFLVQTRLQWLSVMDPDYGPRPDIVVVQLLGTGDDIVSPDDNVDYSIDLYGNRAGSGKCYFYLEVEGSNHSNVVEMARLGPKETESARTLRRETFLSALNDARAALEVHPKFICREHMADSLPPAADGEVDDVVFVVHGIRDKGFWTQKLARNIKRHALNDRKIASWTESYGYFAMLPFLRRTIRQRKVEWFMDRYVEARGRYPGAKFHFVGHSNGTYLLAQGLKDYPAVRFDRIVFAGSVVRTDYDWLSLTKPPPEIPTRTPQVGSVLNYVATQDWVVALLTNGLRCYPVFNLGGAGHTGFEQASLSGPVYQVNYVPGKHDAGLKESNWDDIARFIVSGNPPDTECPRFSKTQNIPLAWTGKIATVLFPGVILLLLGFGIALGWSVFGAVTLPSCEALPSWPCLTWFERLTKKPDELGVALRALGFLAYATVIRTVVTRF
jgi:pimeloyl-ACP methyl ester carboxylesterase